MPKITDLVWRMDTAAPSVLEEMADALSSFENMAETELPDEVWK
jgi:hypothetical protein